MLQSCVYHCHVRHRRYTPVEHGFTYALPVWWIDLDEWETIEASFGGFGLIGRRWWHLFRYCRNDYYGDAQHTLKTSVLDLVHDKLGFRPDGPVRMLTQLRTWGFSFNPVSFYYCYDSSGQRVEAIVAEITNTPWLERFQYVLGTDASASSPSHSFEFSKAFHVSPFHPMDMRYRWIFREPGERLSLHMQNYRHGNLVFDATQVGHRVRLTARSLWIQCLKSPLIPLTVLGGIYWNALKLKCKGAPFYNNPTTTSGSKPVPVSSIGVLNHES